MDPIWLANRSNSSGLADLALLNNNWQMFIIILYTTTAIISLASNLVTIIVLLKGERLSSELWKYLINLSVADITMAIFSIPFTYSIFMLGRWLFFRWLCPVVQFTQICSVFVSVYTLTAIGIDRYFAIVYPFHSLIYLKTHKILVLSVIWIVGIGIASPQLLKTSAVEFPYGNETYYDCRELWDEESGKWYTIFIFVVTFALPISALIFVYTSIAWHILRHNTPGNPDQVRDLAQWNTKVKVVKMLLVIVALFIVCWAPIQVFLIVVWFYPPSLMTRTRYMAYVFTYFFCHFLSMSHSFINPFIYGFMSENFKLSLRKLLRQLWRRQINNKPYNHYGNTIEAELDKFSGSHGTQELSRLHSV